MGILREFKEFVMKGNIIDLAVAVVIGAAFNSVVKSLVDDVMMPPLGYAMGGVDFSDLKFTLRDAGPHPVTSKEMPAVVVGYGKFLNTVVQLLIQALAIFAVIKGLNKLKRQPPPPAPAAPPPLTKDQELLVEIRDLLRKSRA
jgi:large conductance mechanosensitive channel